MSLAKDLIHNKKGPLYMCEIPSNPGLAKCVNRIVYSPIELKKRENDRGKAYHRAWQQI